MNTLTPMRLTFQVSESARIRKQATIAEQPFRNRHSITGPTGARLRLFGLAMILSGQVKPVTAAQFGDFTYNDNGTSITITDYPESAVGAVVIPTQIIGKPVTSIGCGAFYLCRGITSVFIPDTVITIGKTSFVSCSNLTEIEIPESVTMIGENAFFGCGFSRVTIPGNVSSIGSSPFAACRRLTEIDVSPSNQNYISKDGVLFDGQQTTLIQFPAGKTGSYAIPNTVTTIGENAFRSCVVSDVALPWQVEVIDEGAFAYCSNLCTIRIAGGVQRIGYAAFWGCRRLSSAVFLGNAPTIGSDVFNYAADDFKVYFFDGATGFTTPTWQGHVAVNMGATTPVAIWLVEKELPYNANLQEDSNGDGVSILMAYALDLDPKQNLIGSMPEPVIESTQMNMSFYAGRADVAYAVESSTDLMHWSGDGVMISGPDENHVRTASVSTAGPQRYLRLVVSH